MKISGSEQVNISGMTQMELRLNEDRALANTPGRLSQDGKTVINVIHGTPMNGPGSTHKTLTFLWEADDTDPRYIEMKEREAAAAKAAQMREAKERRKKQLDEEIAVLERRISSAQSEAPMLATDIKTVTREERKDGVKHVAIGALIMIGAIAFGIIVGMEGFWAFIWLAGCILFGGLYIFAGCSAFTAKSIEEKVLYNQERNGKRKNDKDNLSFLQKRLDDKKQERRELGI